ncbi:family 78 glycoside hydrolase catalytic domain [Lentilactobacillus kisonensis]|uniref:alpha-L-rhamnosidase n=1 Tax=Lentilactobacillus kisonensis F0435 TaxID=797516 RepID=H1LG31_9LACO|nr:family 78 glycoside hydrolase catalytic domain [Lentilactobacillus kisonensis]EHO51237.1 Alpha-L-rhamnosidase protein [Lentilactobacillus kisonensis F0435]
MINNQNLLIPTHLNVNLLKFAYNVGQTPRFSWWDHSNIANSQQTAYQLVIANRLHQLANQEYVFDSGWVSSDRNTGVEIPTLNQQLESGELYYWQVRIKDNFGNTSDFSQPEKFICTDQVSTASHLGIWAHKTEKVNNELPKLGNVVFIRSPRFDLNLINIDTAVITAFSRGNEPLFIQGFDLLVNGTNVGVGSPHRQVHYQGSDKVGIYYSKYDVTEHLINGENVIAALATAKSDRKAFWCKLEVYLNDGSKKQVIVTNQDWKVLDGSTAFGDYGVKIRSLYFGMVSENVDMRYYPQGWSEIAYNDDSWGTAWINPQEMVNDHELLIPYRSENTRRFETNEPSKKVIKLGDQNYLVDLGKEIIGSLKVNIESPINQRTTVLMGEQLQDDGHVRHHLAAGPDYVENWTFVKGQNKFTTLQVKNFRYIELVGFQGQLQQNDLFGWAIEQPFESQEANFKSDNGLLNREYELSKYTIKATNQDVYVDSQARERRPYEGDLLVNGNTSFVVSSQYSLNRHSMDYLIDNPTWPEDYKLYSIEMAWQDYLYTGNDAFLNQRYKDLTYKLNRGKNEQSFDGASQDFMGSLRNTKGVDNFDERVGLVTNDGLIDWPIPERDGFVEGKYNTPFNAIFYGAYLTMSKIAKTTGHQADAKHYRGRADRIKKALISHLYDSTTGRFYDSLNADLSVNQHTAHHSTAYALCYGIYDSQQMADKISRFVANDGKFVGSIYFIYFMLKGLIDSGHADDAVELLTNPDDRKDQKTFAAILNTLKATIAPEAWSNHYKPNMTLSHPWGATPGLTIVQGIMGINPTKPGFEAFKVKIRPGKLRQVNVQTPSARGIIKAALDVNGGQQLLDITVPMNSKTTIVLPAGAQLGSVKDSGGVDLEGMHTDNDQLILGSGNYHVSYRTN